MITRDTTTPKNLKSAHKTIGDLSKKVTGFQKIISNKNNIISKLDKEEKRLSHENELLREQIALLRYQKFGKKSERQTEDAGPDQQLLFPLEENEEPKEESEEQNETITIKEHERKKKGRKPLPEDLPRNIIIHDIPESQKQCNCGNKLEVIGEEVIEKLEVIPAVFFVNRHVRPKYACKHCEGLEDEGQTVKIAPPVPQIIPKSYASSSLLAHILVSKYCDALPFYRQEQMFKRAGLDLGRGNMSRWAMQISDRIKPMISRLEKFIKSGPLINLDETRVQVLKELDKDPASQSFMWVGRGGGFKNPAIFFKYSPRRNIETAKSFLGNYQGCVQTDGYQAYNYLDKKPGVIHAGCWVHARRKFKEVTNVSLKNKNKKSKKEMLANAALGYIRKLYDVERKAKLNNLAGEELLLERREKSLPILKEFKEWLCKYQPRVPKELLLGKAINYTLNQWHRLEQFITCSAVGLDNNLVENAIRPFAVGRKNWIFSNSVDGANASAAIYSLIETAKANGINPFWYLHYLFEKIPQIKNESEYDHLMPYEINNDILKEFMNKINSQVKFTCEK